MINTKLLNIHDFVLIGSIVIVFHILANPLYDKINSKFGKSNN